MKVIKPDNLSLLFASCMVGDTLCLSVGVCAFFTLDDKATERLLPEGEMWQAVAEALGEEEALDTCFPKPRGEFLVYGSCHPGGRERATQVLAAVGSSAKVLHVSGNRRWLPGGIPSEPEYFEEMKICWEHAFGGEGYAMNPIGKGFPAKGASPADLPNVQAPDALMGSPADRPTPAGFTAYPIHWPQRAEHLGHTDREWLASRWPHLPRDTGPDYFCTAPEDQRQEGYFRGNELIRLVNMHPKKREILSSLPNVRARLFINRSVNAAEVFKEVETRAESVWLFPSQEAGILLFRGLTPVFDEELDDVLHLLADWEPLTSHPLPEEEYRRKFLEAVAPIEAKPAGPAPPEDSEPPPPPPPDAQLPDFPPDLQKKVADLNQEMAKLEAQTDARLKELGMTRDELLKRHPPPPSVEASPEILEKSMAELKARTETHLKQLGMTEEELIKKYLPPPEPTKAPTLTQLVGDFAALEKQTEDQLKKLGTTREAVLKQYVPGLSIGDSVPLAALQKIAAEKDAEMADAAAAVSPPPEPEETPAPTPLTVEDLLARYRRGESLARIDAGGLDFSGQDLRGIDFSEALLEKAVFAGAKLNGALFGGAVVTEVDFSKTDLSGARFELATALQSIFSDARLCKAVLSEGNFTGADFSGADLTGADLAGSQLEGAALKKCVARNVSAPRGSFTGADFSGADFSGSTLTDADFSGANLTDTRFAGISGNNLRLYGVTGQRADFRGAGLRSSRGDSTTALTDAVFQGADLEGSCWDGARLDGAVLDEAVLNNADFSKAVFTRSRLVNASAKGTNFMKSRITDTDLRGINLLKGSLRKAQVTGSDLKDASLYGVDLYGAKIRESDVRGANLKGTILTVTLDDK